MAFELVGLAASKSGSLKKHVPEERKAFRKEMSVLYGKIADTVRRRNSNTWLRQ
jgi:hypothetical protein